MKLKILAFLLPALIMAGPLLAQETRPLTVAVLANATTLPTQPGEIFQNAHPGLLLGTAFRYNESPKNQLAQTVKLGYIFHQFVHHSVQLYSEFEYKRMVHSRINIAGAIGAGYIHLFSATEVFRRNDQGQYEEKPNWGRPQLMGSIALGAGYMLNPDGQKPVEIFMRYQFFVQGPFVRQYVPILPNTNLQLGINYPLLKK